MSSSDFTVSKTWSMIVGSADKPLRADYSGRASELCLSRGGSVIYLPVAYARELHAWLEDIFSGIPK